MTTDLRLLSAVSYRGREISAPRLRGLLALLAADLRAGCGTNRLVGGLWPDERPENPSKALQILVSRARAQLGSDLIVRTATGYRLQLREDQVDAAAVLTYAAASAREAAAGDHPAALAHAEAGLALWSGTADPAPVPDDPLSALRAQRVPAYRSLVRARALALSRLGHPAEAVPALTTVVNWQPRDEEVLLELLRCEAATAGPSAAIARYDAYRRSLRDELGTDPGAALQATYRDLLQGQAPRVRHGIPYEPNELLGRADDIAAVTSLLRTSRVTSVVGPGGLGKTRLAHTVSRRAEQRIVHFVALAGITDDEEVAAEVASVLGVGEPRRTPGGQAPMPRDLVSGIVAAVGPGPALLVLDNCEHVIRGAADLVHRLVAMTPDLRVLTTSRAPLGLSSESVYLLPELDLATAVELFGQRARSARSDVDLPAAAVEELCRHLDGLPLAVELAAARVRTMSVTEIARRFDDRFALLRGAPRDAPQRHQTLHAVVDWSWNLLAPAAQAAMRALSVFPGGFTADAAPRMVGADRAVELLEDLVGQSLLKATESPSGTRFRMLETVREFSAARRAAAGESELVVDRFLGWAREVGTAHYAAIVGADPYPSLELIRAEQDNLVQALRQALARSDGASVAAAAAVLAGLWTIESNYARLLSLVEETGHVLSHYRPPPEYVEVARTVAILSITFAMSILGPRPIRAMVALRRLPPATPDTVLGAAAVVFAAGRHDRAAVHALCDSAEPLVAGVANGIASYLWETAYDLDRALATARRMADSFEQRRVPWLWAQAHARIAELCLQTERAAEARDHLLAALPVLERVGLWPQVGGIRVWLTLASLRLGDVDEAERWQSFPAPGPRDESPVSQGYHLAVCAELSLARGEIDAGLRQWRQVVDQVRADDEIAPGISAELNPWAIEAQTLAVVAHARHGRLHLVAHVTGELRGRLHALLTTPLENPPPYVLELPICGLLLIALAMVDLDRGRRRGDARAARSGARMIALAEQFRFPRTFPTMSVDRARQDAEKADGPAYDEAVSSYAGLDRDGLRAAALAALRERNAD